MDEDVRRMLQRVRTGRSLVLQEPNSVYEVWRGLDPTPEPRSLALAETIAKVKPPSNGAGITVPRPFQMMVREAEKRGNMKAEAETPDQQRADHAECIKQFRAQPVPAHVFLSLYNDIMEQNEKRRKTGVQKRRDHLLAMQKPFHLMIEERRRPPERPASAPTENVPGRKTAIPKSVLDPTVSDRLREMDILRKIKSHLRAQDLLERSSAPVPSGRSIRDPGARTALKTKQQHLEFLQPNPTFTPHTNPSVPDFHMLYRNFQKLSLKNQRIRESTETKPFKLRTSGRSSERQNRRDGVQDILQETPPQRVLAHLSSLSPNTLPVYITDGSKRRQVAIRSSLQDRDKQDIEREERHREHRQKSRTMQNSLSRRAKALDPHTPLSASNTEKLRQKRLSDRRRTWEYKEELEEMMSRVNKREYLFQRCSRHGGPVDWRVSQQKGTSGSE